MRTEPAGDQPRTTLTAFDIACVVIGGIIGIGIFFSPSKVAKAVDSSEQVVWAWAIGGVMIVFGALVYARLSQVAPGYGGVFEYLRRAFGPMPAFLYGWCNLLIIQSGALAVVGLVMVDNLDSALGHTAAADQFSEVMRVVLATVAIVVLTVLNSIGLRLGRNVQITLTVVKTAAVFAIVAIAVFAGSGAPQEDPVREAPVGFLPAMSAALLPVLFACGGWQHGSFVATVARRPLRDVPIGVVAGVVVVVVAYLTVNLAYLELLGLEGAAHSKTIAVDAVAAAMGRGSGGVVARVFGALIVISALGVMNTICMAPPYVLHAMAKQGLFFRGVSNLHARFGTPLVAIVLQGAWAAVLLWITQVVAWVANAVPAGGEPLPQEERLDPLGFLLDGVVFVDWLFYGSCAAALLLILRRRERFERGDRLYFAAGVLFALSALTVTAGSLVRELTDPDATQYPSSTGLIVLVAGLAAYALFERSARRPATGG